MTEHIQFPNVDKSIDQEFYNNLMYQQHVLEELENVKKQNIELLQKNKEQLVELNQLKEKNGDTQQETLDEWYSNENCWANGTKWCSKGYCQMVCRTAKNRTKYIYLCQIHLKYRLAAGMVTIPDNTSISL